MSIKQAYLKEKKLQESHVGQQVEITQLPCKPRGRPLLMGALDSKVQLLLNKIRDSGGVVNSRIAISVARGLLLYYSPSLLLENGGHLDWLVEAADYISQNPLFLVNGFIKAGITGCIDGSLIDDEDDQEENNYLSDDFTESDDDDSLI